MNFGLEGGNESPHSKLVSDQTSRLA